MHHGDIVREGLEKNEKTITEAAKWLGLTRQSFYIRLNKGTFTVNEFNVLISKGIVNRTRMYTIEQIGDYLLKQRSLEEAIMNLDEDSL